jgi:hypothetical protein
VVAVQLQVHSDLCDLYAHHGVKVSHKYKAVSAEIMGSALAYATPMMRGIVETIFSSPIMIAFNLIQNSIDEAKGAARVQLIANRYATGDLQAKMDRHVSDEFKHSVQFRQLLDVVEVGEFAKSSDDPSQEIENVLQFDDDLVSFMCRVHSIEIRSWTMLRMYIDVLEQSGKPNLLRGVPVICDILDDEITHVLYTGQQLSDWLDKDPAIADIMRDCFLHTNRETWRDLSNMATHVANHHEEIWQAPAMSPAARTAMQSPA